MWCLSGNKQFISQALRAILTSLVLVGLSACSTHLDNAEIPAGASHIARPLDTARSVRITDKAAQAIGLTTDVVKLQDIQLSAKLPAKIEPDLGKEVDISSRVAGRIDALFVKPGVYVEKGRLLALVTSKEVSDLEAELVADMAKLATAKIHEERERQAYQEHVNIPKALLSARTTVKEAQLRCNLLHSQLKRSELMYKEKIAAAKDYVAARAAYEEAVAKLEHAEANLKLEGALYKNRAVLRAPYQVAQAERHRAEKDVQALKSQLKFLGVDVESGNESFKQGTVPGVVKIVAPIQGVLGFFDVAPGELIEADKPVFRVTDTSTVLVKADVPEIDIPAVAVGKRLDVLVRGNKEPIPATIEFVSEHVDPNTRTLAIRARVANPNHTLKIGMFADVQLDKQTGHVLAVPKAAVQETEGNKIVFVKSGEADEFAERKIETGLEDPNYVEVKKGLAEGEIIATEGSLLLKNQLTYSQNQRND